MTAPRSGRPDPDGHHDDLSAEDLDGLSFVVPDDPRELAADREAWLRESAASAPPPTGVPDLRVTDASGPPVTRRRRLSLTAGLVVLSMLVVALSGVVGALVAPKLPDGPPAAPLADVRPAPGQVGGLLPEAGLTDGTTPVAARSLRPSVIVLVPMACPGCAELVAEVRRQAAEFGLAVTLVGAPDQTAQLADLERSLGGLRIQTLTDPTKALATAYGPTAPTLLLVRDDGVVVDIVRDPAPGLRLEATLLGLSDTWAA